MPGHYCYAGFGSYYKGLDGCLGGSILFFQSIQSVGFVLGGSFLEVQLYFHDTQMIDGINHPTITSQQWYTICCVYRSGALITSRDKRSYFVWILSKITSIEVFLRECSMKVRNRRYSPMRDFTKKPQLSKLLL